MRMKIRMQGWGIKMQREEWEWKGVSPVSLVEWTWKEGWITEFHFPVLHTGAVYPIREVQRNEKRIKALKWHE